ncbi:MAG: DUF2087 domain-containing protein [Bacillota bacterium]
MNISDMLWNASIEELKLGYIQHEDKYICFICGEIIEKGIVYHHDDTFYEAEKYMRVHVENSHGSMFEYLIGLDKKLTGLTEHQNSLLRLFYQGKSDKEIQSEMDTGSISTIRNHRFALKEKERQAKLFLTMMELIRDKNKNAPAFIEVHRTATILDDRFNVTRQESEKVLDKYFNKDSDRTLKSFNMKEKNKLIVLKEIAKRFEAGRTYHEKEINEILMKVYEDHVTLRRYLVEYGFLDREQDGSRYWLKEVFNEKGDRKMDRKAELKQLYKETEAQAGVFQIRNTINNKILVMSTMNLKTINGKLMELKSGTIRNDELQKDVKQYGFDAFVIEVLEVMEKKEDRSRMGLKDDLEKLEKSWLDKLKPYGERGYNREKLR